ncbi:glycoside hydrolase family 9 protein [Dyadobacter sp. CY261]|uniref:glycoside hydrolase family 9 protein n=1 Tax=Dyadobacter sp. CY261 TaxID=2907203 RepID=UPI001F41E2B1|nr:glycoside hydrolase family 9 protein [Dyadobacter sp. CY261]MCF0073924.1 glycoside hydrolase family 9 protein [Dyadobacter sp. CY261]
MRKHYLHLSGRGILTFMLAILLSVRGVAQISQFIHVDQFGYAPTAEKVAVLSNPVQGYNAALSYAPPATLEVRNSVTDAVAFSGPISVWNNGNTQDNSGDRGWWFDFSVLTATGSYYVFDPVNGQRSAVFEITANPYGNVMLAAMKMFYYNRCNMAKAIPYAQSKWTDGNNFMNPLQDANARYVYEQGNAALEKNLTGGWFDAGDYNKYVSFTHSPLHDLLYAYEENPSVFTDNFNIPESKNGIPDILDEVKWELDWLFKMTNADGSTHNKMGSRNYSENISSPPSANVDGRYYGPTCTSASATIASVFSHAALVYAGNPLLAAYASQLEAKAISCFNYVLPFYNGNTLQTNCDDGSIVSGDADVGVGPQRNMMVIAAIYLFEKTGNAVYNQFVVNNYAGTDVMSSGYWGVDATELQDALLRYAKLPGATTAVATAITNSAGTAVNGNWNDFFGWTTADLYRAFMPDWSYHWGSNMPKADYANVNRTMLKAGLGDANSLRRKAAEQIHYFHGVNPQGIVYLSNMYSAGGDRCANEIYHTWFNDGTIYDNALTSPNGPAPGYVVGGPNADYTISSQSPPYGQPRQKSYLDFNTGWPTNSWEITEPAIYYQAAYVRLLAHLTLPIEDPLPVELADFYLKELDGGNAQLYWKTVSEIDNERFEIERSVDGVDFRMIGEVKGNHNSQQARFYTFTDNEVPDATTYYRLKQVDIDGQFEYSKIIALYRNGEAAFRLGPNPLTEFVDLQMPAHVGSATVKLTSMSGVELMRSQVNRNGRVSISNLPKGIYILQVEKGKERLFTQRIFKN